MITEEEYQEAKLIVREYEARADLEDIEFMKYWHAECKRNDDEWDAKVASGEIVPTILTQEIIDYYRRM